MDGDEPRDEDTGANSSRERGGVETKVNKAVSVAFCSCQGERDSRHDGSSLMEKEDVGNGQRSKALSRTAREAHENPSSQRAAIRGRSASPSCARGVHGKGEDVEGSSSVFDHDGHPYQIAQSLEKGRRRKKVRDLGNASIETQVRVTEKVLGDLDDSYGRAGCEEVAEEDGDGNEAGNVQFVAFGPGGYVALALFQS